MSLATLLPGILLSGFMFPREAMPVFFQYLSLGIPMTHYIEILRMIFLKGGGMDALWRQAIFLTFFTALFFVVAVRKFKRSIA